MVIQISETMFIWMLFPNTVCQTVLENEYVLKHQRSSFFLDIAELPPDSSPKEKLIFLGHVHFQALGLLVEGLIIRRYYCKFQILFRNSSLVLPWF